LIALARLCQFHKNRPLASVELYQRAFEADPRFLEDQVKFHRYNAACMGAMAGAAQGQDAAKLPAKEQARRHRQALDWLRADVDTSGLGNIQIQIANLGGTALGLAPATPFGSTTTPPAAVARGLGLLLAEPLERPAFQTVPPGTTRPSLALA